MSSITRLTSKEALEHARSSGVLGASRLRCLEVLHSIGYPATALDVSRWAERFRGGGPVLSGETVRKRLPELLELGLVEHANTIGQYGRKRATWKVVPNPPIPRAYREKKATRLEIVRAFHRVASELGVDTRCLEVEENPMLFATLIVEEVKRDRRVAKRRSRFAADEQISLEEYVDRSAGRIG